MVMLFQSWALPIRLVNQPVNSWWSNPLVTALIGFLFGLLAEPIKQEISAIRLKRRALRRLYDDLGRYIGRVEDLALKSNL